MCEVGLGSDEEAEEGVKPTIHRPELLAGCEGQGEGVDGDVDVDMGMRMRTVIECVSILASSNRSPPCCKVIE